MNNPENEHIQIMLKEIEDARHHSYVVNIFINSSVVDTVTYHSFQDACKAYDKALGRMKPYINVSGGLN
jgi:hypothetical protein